MARMDDGFATTISFPSHASIKFYEKTVTPPGVSGEGAIDTTTMLNTTYRTRKPKSLKTLTDSSVTVAYDPAVYPEILAIINDNQLITITYPDTSTLVFYGWVDSFVPGAQTEGEQPTAEVSIISSNQTDGGVEYAPVWAS